MYPSRHLTVLLAACTLAVAGRLQAQASPGSAFSLALGAHQSAQRNEGASPYRHSGFGPELSLGYGRWRATSASGIAFTVAQGRLNSALTRSSVPREQLYALAVDVRYLRRAGGLLGARWSLGGSLKTRLEVSEHFYWGPYESDVFGWFTSSIGPTVRGRWMAGRAVLENDLTLPLLGLVDFPWANGRSNGGGLSLSPSSFLSLRTVDDVLVLRPDSLSRLSWVYRLSYLSHPAGQSHRVARHSLSVMIDFRRRGAPR